MRGRIAMLTKAAQAVALGAALCSSKPACAWVPALLLLRTVEALEPHHVLH